MATAERDFSNYQAGDNIYSLGYGVIPVIAEGLDVTLGDRPNSYDLQRIMDRVGPNKVLRDNQEITAFDLGEMVELVEYSGVQKSLRRSLWDPEIQIHDDNVDAIVIVGGVANWQDRVASLVDDLPAGKPVYSLAGPRITNTDTEKSNPNVARIAEAFGRYPTEAEYAGSIVVPKLVAARREVLPITYTTGDADEMFAKFFEQNPDLLDARLVLARVANAGIIMAIQLLKAARNLRPSFDNRPYSRPQIFIATDSFPLARNGEQEKDARHFQKAATALRQVVLTAKKLHEAATS